MRIVNVHEAKTTLSKLLDEVERGGRVVIARNGHPVAELRAIVQPTMAEAVAAFRNDIHIDLTGLTVRELVDEGRR
jgi:antitoxin (DNA-binding transcriptional repressor) of toxin-antitoxin stability system